MHVLFLNHTQLACGVYQYGKRLFELLVAVQCDDATFAYAEVDSLSAYCEKVRESAAEIVLYNFHGATMPWLNRSVIVAQPGGKIHVGIHHESPVPFFDYIVDVSDLARPLFEHIPDRLSEGIDPVVKDFVDYAEEDSVPVFGSFGFGFDNKGFHKIVEMVNQQYDRAIIKFIIPMAFYDPNRAHTLQLARNKCIAANVKHPNVKLMILHTFLSNEDILYFLSKSTMNMFLYDKMNGRGVSSAIDYAMSVGRPIGISDSHMFRNVYRDDICLYKCNIRDCMVQSKAWLESSIDAKKNNDLLRQFFIDNFQEMMLFKRKA